MLSLLFLLSSSLLTPLSSFPLPPSCGLSPQTSFSPHRTPPYHRPSSLSAEKREPEPDLKAQAAWKGAELLGKAAALTSSPSSPLPSPSSSPSSPPSTLLDAVSRIESDWSLSYFLSGTVDRSLYDPDCLFADDIASFRGTDRFAENLKNLDSFVGEYKVRRLGAVKGEKGGEVLLVGEDDTGRPTVTGRALVDLTLNLPWRPTLSWVWKVTHVLEETEGRAVVVEHREAWEIEVMKGIGQVFRPGKEKKRSGEA